MENNTDIVVVVEVVKSITLNKELEILKSNINALLLNDKSTEIEIGKVRVELIKKLDELNKELILEDFKAFVITKNPIETVIGTLFHNLYKVKEVRDKNSKIVTNYTIEDAVQQIDLSSAYEFFTRTLQDVCPDKTWSKRIPVVLKTMAYRTCIELKAYSSLKELKKQYNLSDIVVALDKGETPMSNTRLMKLLQIAVDGIIPEYKVRSHDVQFVLKSIAVKKDGIVAIPRQSTMISMILFMLNKLYTGEQYGVKATI